MATKRLIDANAIPWEECFVPNGDEQFSYRKELCVIKPVVDKMPTVKAYTAHEVAEILAEFCGDYCSCNYNGIDEWLPEYCELLDACPDTVGVACWEQFLKFRSYGERKDDDGLL